MTIASIHDEAKRDQLGSHTAWSRAVDHRHRKVVKPSGLADKREEAPA